MKLPMAALLTARSARPWAAAALGLAVTGCISLQPLEGGACDLGQGLGCADGWRCLAGQCRPVAGAVDAGILYDDFEQYPAAELGSQARFGRWELLEGASAAIEQQFDPPNKVLLLRAGGSARWVTLDGEFHLGVNVTVGASNSAVIAVSPLIVLLDSERWSVWTGETGALAATLSPRPVELYVEAQELVLVIDGRSVGRFPAPEGPAPVYFGAVGEARLDDVWGVSR